MHKNAVLTPRGREVMVLRVRDQGWSVGRAAEAAGVSRKTVYTWAKRYEQDGPAGLEDRSSRPRHSPNQLSWKVVERIRRLRKRRFTGREIAERLKLARSTVGDWLRRLGLGKLKALEPKEPVIRYERKRPGELLHVDTKKLGRIQGVGHRIHGNRRRRARGVGWEFLHVCIDDHSRVAYVEVLPDERAITVTAFVRRACAWFHALGVTVEGIMTDNGSGYRSKLFARLLSDLGVRHLFTRPYTPKTNGKAERFIQTALREWAYRRAYRSSAGRRAVLPTFQRRYNRCRRHSAIGDKPPFSRLPAQL